MMMREGATGFSLFHYFRSSLSDGIRFLSFLLQGITSKSCASCHSLLSSSTYSVASSLLQQHRILSYVRETMQWNNVFVNFSPLPMLALKVHACSRRIIIFDSLLSFIMNDNHESLFLRAKSNDQKNKFKANGSHRDTIFPLTARTKRTCFISFSQFHILEYRSYSSFEFFFFWQKNR